MEIVAFGVKELSLIFVMVLAIASLCYMSFHTYYKYHNQALSVTQRHIIEPLHFKFSSLA